MQKKKTSGPEEGASRCDMHLDAVGAVAAARRKKHRAKWREVGQICIS